MGQTSRVIATAWLGGRVAAFKSMSQVEKAYAFGMVLCAIGILMLVVRVNQAIAGPLFWGAGLFLFGALAREAYVIVVGHLESVWAKWLLVPVAVMVSAYSLGSAANIVNAASGQDPGLFPRTTAFMAPVAAIPALALLVSVLAGIALTMMFFAWASQLSSKDKTKAGRAWVWLGRIGGAFATISLVSPVIVEESGFGQSVEKVAGWMAQGLDMHSDQACAAGEWDRVLRVNDELVVVARRTEAGLRFRRELCSLRAES
jgi:hypothetical protein